VLDRLAALARIAEIDAEALCSDTELAEIPQRLAELVLHFEQTVSARAQAVCQLLQC
jgi:hypothetical protein